MFLSIFSSLDNWIYQMKSLIIHRFHHLTPQEYTVMLVICIVVGLVMLRGKQ